MCKVIILCGGQGTRLKEETEFKPKPMVNIGGKPLLWHIMKTYAYWGFNEFILALGYKAEYIKDYFLNQKAFNHDFTLNTNNHEINYHINKNNNDDFKITFADTGAETLIGERTARCKKYIPPSDKYSMLTYGDGLSNVNIKKLFNFHVKSKSIVTLTGVHPRSKYGLIKTGKDNKVISFTEKPVLKDLINGGFMVLSNDKVFDYFHKNEMEHDGLQRLAKLRKLSVYKHKGYWFSIDTYRELEVANKEWAAGEALWKIWN